MDAPLLTEANQVFLLVPRVQLHLQHLWRDAAVLQQLLQVSQGVVRHPYGPQLALPVTGVSDSQSSGYLWFSSSTDQLSSLSSLLIVLPTSTP